MSNESVAVLDIEEKHFQLISGRNYLVGRKSEAGGRLDIELQNESLDPKHAIIRMCGDTAKIIDLHSKSGTFLNKCRLNGMDEVTIAGSATLQFGEIVGKLQLNMIGESHDSSGFHDGIKNTSDIICSSPEPTFQSRLKRSQNSTSNGNGESEKDEKSVEQKAKAAGNFLVPSLPSRRSGLSDTSRNSFNISATERLNVSDDGDRTTDSFFIPETQHCEIPKSFDDSSKEQESRNNESTHCSVNADSSRLKSGQDDNDDDDDYCIPETQDLDPLPSSQMRKRFRADQAMLDINMPANIFEEEDDAALGGTQYRICTQDYNLFGNELDDSDTSDLIDDVPCSLIIPRVEHSTVMLSESGHVLKTDTKSDDNSKDLNETHEKEMSALNWSEADSKCTAEASQRDYTCTPDPTDSPELAQINAVILNNSHVSGKNVNDGGNSSPTTTSKENNEPPANKTIDKSSTSFEVPAVPSISHENKCFQVIEPSLFEDDEDLLPTQIFASDPKDDKKVGGKCTPEYLTLSDKENVVPAVAEMLETVDEMQPTQVFAVRPSASTSTNLNNGPTNQFNIPSSSKKTASEPTAPATINEPMDDDDFMLPTQVFPIKNKKVSQKDNQKPSTSNCLSSTLIATSDDRVKNAESFFADMEKSTKKIPQIDVPKPVEAITENPSAPITNNSMSESPDIEFLLCTPQIVKQFEMEVKKDLSRQIKQKSLFGDDSEEDEDVHKRISAPKASHDFDMLLPHLKRQESPKREKVETYVHTRAIKSNQLNNAKKVARNRDERHLLRDKVRDTLHKTEHKDEVKEVKVNKKDDKKESPKIAPTVDQSSDSRTRGRKRKSIVHKDASPSKTTKQKEEDNKSVPSKLTEKKTKKRKASIEEQPEKIATDNSKGTSQKKKLRSKSNGETEETAVELPTRRITRLRSRTEEIHLLGVDATNVEGTELKKKTRGRKRSDEKMKEKELKDDDKNNKPTHSRSKDNRSKDLKNDDSSKKGSASITETKRRSLRSTSSVEDSNSQSSTSGSSNHIRHVKRLKVSMTMVNPEHFQNLANNSSGIWTIAQDPTESDILIMDKGNRTFKFLLAMAKGLPIVKSSWLEAVNKIGKIINMSEHFYVDESFEKRHKFSIVKSIELARKQKLFAGYDFLMTPSIRPEPHEMKAIIRCAGGTVHSDPPAYKDNQKLYLISTKDDQKLWHKYRRLNSNIRIISTEGVMSSVMRQTSKPLDYNVLA